MASIEQRLHEIERLRTLQRRPHWMNRLHPLGKLLLSVFYVFTVVSVDRYHLTPMVLFSVYPAAAFILGELSLKDALYRMRLILPLVLFAGIFNPFLDQRPLGTLFGLTVTGGMLSMVTLMLKGFYAVLSAYILIATTSIEEICYALRCLHVPKLIVTVVLLISRYSSVMGEEAARITMAYQLRAPSQKGIRYRAWGTLVGQWLLRSYDRAEAVYESMLLRGFTGEFHGTKRKVRAADVLYPAVWISLLLMLRVFFAYI